MRVEKAISSGTTVYFISGMKVLAEYNLSAAPSSPNKECIYAASSLLATIQGTTTTYHHPDHLSVRLDTDSSGNVVGQQANFPFGESWYATNTITSWQFTSYERDVESGKGYSTFRYTLNRLGRFNSPDLLGGIVANPQSLNRYACVQNNPLSLVDPFGLFCVWDDGSYDSQDDPSTGTKEHCELLGGTCVVRRFALYWGLGGDWSPNANPIVAGIVQWAQDNGFTSITTQQVQKALRNNQLQSYLPGPTIGPGQAGIPADPLACSTYLDGTGAGQILFNTCTSQLGFLNGSWGNCVREKLLNQYVPNGNPFQLGWYLVADHLYDFGACVGQ